MADAAKNSSSDDLMSQINQLLTQAQTAMQPPQQTQMPVKSSLMDNILAMNKQNVAGQQASGNGILSAIIQTAQQFNASQLNAPSSAGHTGAKTMASKMMDMGKSMMSGDMPGTQPSAGAHASSSPGGGGGSEISALMKSGSAGAGNAASTTASASDAIPATVSGAGAGVGSGIGASGASAGGSAAAAGGSEAAAAGASEAGSGFGAWLAALFA